MSLGVTEVLVAARSWWDAEAGGNGQGVPGRAPDEAPHHHTTPLSTLTSLPSLHRWPWLDQVKPAGQRRGVVVISPRLPGCGLMEEWEEGNPCTR